MENSNEVSTILEKITFIVDKMRPQFPEKAVVTAGMPYANGPLHLGHLAGTHIPADIYSRFLRLLIGKENILFVCGTDDHGSTSEVAARKRGQETPDFIREIYNSQAKTLRDYQVSLDVYSGTSPNKERDDNGQIHRELCQEFIRKIYANGRLEKKTSLQWYDPAMNMFLPDRYVSGTCPRCGEKGAYSEECDHCGAQYEAKELQNPQSTLSNATPTLKETKHWFLNMEAASDQLNQWLKGNQKKWRKNLLAEVLPTIRPTFQFSNIFEEEYKKIKEELPPHKSRYAPGKKIALSFDTLEERKLAEKKLREVFKELKEVKEFKTKNFDLEILNSWGHRSFTRDVSWGIPVPEELDPEMKGKTLYVWPESLIAPISFTKLALKERGLSPEGSDLFWKNPKAQVYQFLGQDNIFFYVLMQGSMWLSTQSDPQRLPLSNEYQMTDIFSRYHLQINGAKMSKSKGNFFTGDQLIQEMGYSPDQIRYFLSTLSLNEKNSNFDEETLKKRNQFLAGPLNAAFEKPLSACHSKFGGKIPAGNLIGKTGKETQKIIPHYLKMMQRGEYAKLLFSLENYIRIINGLFTQFKPHDDRCDEQQRKDALYSSFYILRNTLIMLSPFVPETMEKLRGSLNLPPSIYSLSELGKPMPEKHLIGKKVQYFPPC